MSKVHHVHPSPNKPKLPHVAQPKKGFFSYPKIISAVVMLMLAVTGWQLIRLIPACTTQTPPQKGSLLSTAFIWKCSLRKSFFENAPKWVIDATQWRTRSSPVPTPTDKTGIVAENKVSEPAAPSIHAAGFCIKKIESKSSHICGEDAFLVKVHPNAPTFLGVADGVGGWGESGGDSSKISTGILSEIDKLVVDGGHHGKSLSELIKEAFGKMIAMKTHKLGSTTICSSVYDPTTGYLDIANLGDSAAMLFREKKLVFKTKIGVEGFNAPHQVGFDQFGNAYGEMGWMTTSRIKIKSGDILVLATDGLIDNVFDEEVGDMAHLLVHPSLSQKGNKRMMVDAKNRPSAIEERLKSAATTLAYYAFGRSTEKTWKSPFADGALSAGYYFLGGKQDDITVVVAYFD